MQHEINIQVTPEQAATESLLLPLASSHLSIPKADINHIEILKRSIDARQRQIKVNLRNIENHIITVNIL